MRTASEVSFLQPDIPEHSLYQGNVLGLAAVRCACHGELLVAPPERVKPARAEKGQHLKRLGAGSPVSESVSVTRCAKKLVAFPNYCGVYTMLRFNPFTAGNCDIELVRLDHAE